MNSNTAKENINVRVEKGVGKLTIRHGQALPLPEPKKILVEGTIDAPSLYFLQRQKNGLVDIKRCLVTFSAGKKAPTVTYEADPTDAYAATVIGKVSRDEELTAFDINGEKKFSLSAIIDFLRIRRHLFVNPEAHTALLGALKDLRTKSTTNIESKRDERGNAKALIDVQTESNVPLDFTLSIPLFVGGLKKTFKVEIGMEVRSMETSYWFYSDELPALLQASVDEMLKDALLPFRQAGCAVLEV